jgi:hypothetical protein
MSPRQSPASETTSSEDSRPEALPATPDEDGPHDVPDEDVIEATLPARGSKPAER